MKLPLNLRVALIRPPILELHSNLSSYGAILPIGLAYIAAVLRDAGHQITVIDAAGERIDHYTQVPSPLGTLHMNGLTPDQILQRIPKDADLVGITHMFLHEWPTIREIARKVKERLPNTCLVAGGENVTAFSETMMRETPAIDYYVLGEGERTILELVARLQQGLSTDDIDGLVSRHADQQEGERLPARIADIDELPRPAWEFFPVENYLNTVDHHGVHRGRSMPMLATRGCPYQCTFCSSPQMWTTRYVARSPQSVVDEMKDYKERYKIENVNFCDLTTIIKRDWIIEFCNILKKDAVNLTWQLPTGTRSEALDEEVLNLLYETGCRNITYAPESGSERMLAIIKKKIKIERMFESLKAARRAKLVTRVNIIIGHPEERRSDTWKSLWFLVQAAWYGCEDSAVMIFAPYPGSEDFRKLIEKDRVQVTEDYYYLPLARSGWSSRTYNPVMGTAELIFMQFFMLSVFYALAYMTRPWRIWHVLKSLFSGNEQTQMDQLLRTKYRQLLNPSPRKGG